MVDFENRDRSQAVDPVRARVESGSEDHELAELLRRDGRQGVVDQTCSGDD
jgi:hypothetical protein